MHIKLPRQNNPYIFSASHYQQQHIQHHHTNEATGSKIKNKKEEEISKTRKDFS